MKRQEAKRRHEAQAGKDRVDRVARSFHSRASLSIFLEVSLTPGLWER